MARADGFRNLKVLSVPADGTSAATEGNGDLRYVADLWAALGQATACL
jgi:hypothetical protein